MPVRFIDKPCGDCGKIMVGVNPLRLYCDECHKRRKRERREAAKIPRRHFYCAQCGALTMREAPKQRLCPECRIKNRLQSRKSYYKRISIDLNCRKCGRVFRFTPPNDDAKVPRLCHECRQAETRKSVYPEPEPRRTYNPSKDEAWRKVGNSNPGLRYGQTVAQAALEQQRKEMEERRKQNGW